MKSFFKSTLFACSLMTINSIQAVRQSKEISHLLHEHHAEYLKRIDKEDSQKQLNTYDVINICIASINIWGKFCGNDAYAFSQKVQKVYETQAEVVQQAPNLYYQELVPHLAEAIAKVSPIAAE